MRKPRTNILLLTTIFAIVGLIGQAWLAGKEVSLSLFSQDHAMSASPVVPATDASLRVKKSLDVPVLAPQPLSDDASVLVAEMCDLQLAAQGTDLTLNSSQWPVFAAVVLRIQAIRHAYEAQIANLKMIAPGEYRAEIPEYTSVGEALREQFSRELRTELGETTALEVMAKLGDRLEKRFAGFGFSVQTVDLTTGLAGGPNDIQLTRTVSYWNRVDGSERLITRSEIHFPSLEDPTGESWGALLAKVSDVVGAENGPG